MVLKDRNKVTIKNNKIMKNFNEMTRDELRKEASARGIKNYITMSNLKLIEALEADEARKQSVAEQLGQDAKSKCDQAIEFYDQLASYGASELYAKVDSIVDDREMQSLEESELDEILALRSEFNPADFKEHTVETDKDQENASVKKAKAPKAKKEAAGKLGISPSNPILPQIKNMLAEGKSQAKIAEELGKSKVYIYKCIKAIKSAEASVE